MKCRQGKGFVAFLAKQVQDFERIVLQTHIPHPQLSQIKKAIKVVHNN
ncbi:MAG: hypothetical protein GPJ21_24630 [Microcystis aeruginosa W13-11]|nr:hypothetical protein [Microcystis aeruginosa W13-11]